MKNKSLIILIALSFLCSIKPTYAITVKEYELVKKADLDWTEDYINAVGVGIFWSNAMLWEQEKQRLYCSPSKLSLNAGNYIRILEEEIQNGGYTKESPVEMILLFGLIRTFPCSEDK